MFDKTKTVGDVVTSASRDLRTLFTGNSATLIDYVDRVSLELLRSSKWQFLISGVKQFVTRKGVTDYWIGAASAQAYTNHDTLLNLRDVRNIKSGSVYDRTNNNELFPGMDTPNRRALVRADSLENDGRPKQYIWDPDIQDVFKIIPAPDNQNSYRPLPNAPLLSTSATGSSEGARTSFVQITFEDELGGESALSKESSFSLAAGERIKVHRPIRGITENDQSIQYNGWNVYIGLTAGSGTKQNTSVIPINEDFTEPTTSLIAGDSASSSSTIAPVGGYVIEFRYWEDHVGLSTSDDVLQIPNDYFDIVVAGVNGYGFKFMAVDLNEALFWFSRFEEGKRQIQRDFRRKEGELDFIRPDSAALYTGISP